MIRLTLLLSLFSTAIFAQNAAIMPYAVPTYFYSNASGQPLPGGFVYTCVAGTACTSTTVGGVPSNPLATYTDSTATTQNPNPVVLNAAGQAQIWGSNLPYKIVVQNYQGVVQWTADNVQPAGPFNSNIATNPLYIDLALQSGALVNSPTTCNDTALRAAITAAVSGPGWVLAPAGTWYLCSTISIPQGVTVGGVGHWSQEPEYGTVQNTVFKAGSSFSVGTGYQSRMFTLGGLTNNTQYGGRIENASIDGSGIADGVYVAQGEEHTGMAFVDTLNFPYYGLTICGADAGGPCGSNQPNGAQSDGDYHDLQFAPSDQYGMTSGTVSMFLDNLTGIREIRNVTFAPYAANPANKPNYAAVAWGFKFTFRHWHMENIANSGILLSPPSTPCPGACGGSIGAVLEDINGTSMASGANLIKIQSATNTNEKFINLNDDGSDTCLISYGLSNGYSGCIGGTSGTPANQPVTDWWIDGAGIPMGHEYVEIFNGAVNTNAQVTMRNGTTHQLCLSGAGSTFGLNCFYGRDDGQLFLTQSTAKAGINLIPSGFTPLSIYNGTQYSGMNIGAVNTSGTLNTRTNLCSNVYWDNSGNWTSGGNGGSDYSCLLDLNYGYGLSLSNTGASGSGSLISNTTMFSNFAWVVNKTGGHTIFGPNSVNTSTGAINDTNAGQIQTPSVGDTSDSNTDLSGVLTFTSSNTSSTYSFLASGTNKPICTITSDFNTGFIYINYGGSAHTWNITAKVNTGTPTGNAYYTCILKP